jgi:uncharacterized protein YjbI with pentapeptide repeats
VDEAMLWLTDRAPDVRAAMLVLDRYLHEQREHRLPLRRIDLRRTNQLLPRDPDQGGPHRLQPGRRHATGVRWEQCRFFNTDLRKTRLTGATLDQSEFNPAHLQEANLAGASLREANLSDASLRGANLRGADLRGAKLFRADLSGADLSGAHPLGALLGNVRADHTTTWPAGFTS